MIKSSNKYSNHFTESDFFSFLSQWDFFRHFIIIQSMELVVIIIFIVSIPSIHFTHTIDARALKSERLAFQSCFKQKFKVGSLLISKIIVRMNRKEIKKILSSNIFVNSLEMSLQVAFLSKCFFARITFVWLVLYIYEMSHHAALHH